MVRIGSVGKRLNACRDYVFLPLNNEAFTAAQNFNILVSKAPVDAEVSVLQGGQDCPHEVTVEDGDVLFPVGWRQ